MLILTAWQRHRKSWLAQVDPAPAMILEFISRFRGSIPGFFPCYLKCSCIPTFLSNLIGCL